MGPIFLASARLCMPRPLKVRHRCRPRDANARGAQLRPVLLYALTISRAAIVIELFDKPLTEDCFRSSSGTLEKGWQLIAAFLLSTLGRGGANVLQLLAQFLMHRSHTLLW